MKFGEYNTIKELFLPKAQSGMFLNPNMFQQPNVGQLLQSQMYSQPQDTSVYNPYGWTPPADIDTSVFSQPERQRIQPLNTQSVGVQPFNVGITTPDFNEIEEQNKRQAELEQKYGNVQYNDRLNLINPYGGVGIEAGLAYGAYHAGQGNTGQASLGFSRGLLGMARVGANAYSKGKAYKEGLQAQDNTFNPNYVTLQKGGEITMADLFTNKYITDAPNPNVEIEEREYTFNSENGMVQKAVGESHENGGIPTYLPPQSKVLSDYEKVGKINAKELSKYLGVKVKPTDTYASALDKYSNKIGVKKNSKEEAELLEKTENLMSKDDNDTKDLNAKFLQKEFVKVEEKKQELNTKQQEAFQELFNRQEIAKGTINNTTPMFQQGGETQPQTPEEVFQYLLSQGMTEEEAVAYMEQGQQNQGGDIIQQVVQALQQGADPQEVLAYLVEQGIPQDQAIQVIEQVMQQGQSQQFMQSGGIVEDTRTGRQRPYMDGEQLKPWERLVGAYQEDGNIITLTDQEVGRVPSQTTNQPTSSDYDFSTSISPTVDGRTVTSQRVTEADRLTAEPIQSFAGAQGYGRNVQDVDRFMDTHSWYFNDADKREQFKQAVGTKGSQEQVKAFQEAYNNEIRRRGEEAGLTEADIDKYVNEIGFTGDKVQSMDGLFGAYTSSRPLFTTDTQPPTSEEEVEEVDDNKVVTTPETVNRLRNVVPMLPNMFTMPPSAMQIPRQDQVSFNRITPTIRTPEVSIAQANNQANFAIEQAYANNPNLAPFLTANLLGTTQQSANQAIAETDAYNAQAINQANLYNTQVGDKEQLMNINLNQNFEQRLFGSLANQEADWRRYFTNAQLQQRQNWQDVNNLNLMNQLYDNYQTDGVNTYFGNARFIRSGSPATGFNNMSREQLLKELEKMQNKVQ